MLRIRLRRMGARNAPFYRVVVSDSHKTPTSSAIEEIGYYDPRRNPKVFEVNRERVDHWVGNGARLSDTVAQLLEKYSEGAGQTAAAEQIETATPEPATQTAAAEESVPAAEAEA